MATGAVHPPRHRAQRLGRLRRGACLFMNGVFGFIWGLGAVLNDKAVTVGGQGVLIADFTTWGWVHIIVGVLMVATACGIFAMAEWSRWAAIFFAMLQAILQVGVFPAFPAVVGGRDRPRRRRHLPAHGELGDVGSIGITPCG